MWNRSAHRHLVDIAVKVAPAEARRRHRQSRLRQPKVAQTGPASVPFDLIAMNLQHLGKTEEYWGQGY